VAFTPDGKHVLVPDRQANDLRIYEAASRKQVKVVAVCQGPGGIVVSPDGKTAYVACQASNNVNVIDTGTWTVTRTIAPGSGPDGLALR
jgi:YVTN family beta-propeller protein